MLFQRHFMIKTTARRFDTLFKIRWPFSPVHRPVQSAPKVNKRNLWNSCLLRFFLIVRVYVIWQMFMLKLLIEKQRPDVLKLSTTFYDFSVSCDLTKNCEPWTEQSKCMLHFCIQVERSLTSVNPIISPPRAP